LHFLFSAVGATPEKHFAAMTRMPVLRGLSKKNKYFFGSYMFFPLSLQRNF
jgi:hypothetical protein